MKNKSNFYIDRETETITIPKFSGGFLYCLPGFSLDQTTTGTGGFSQDSDVYSPFIVDKPSFFEELAIELVTAANAGATFRLGIYAADIDMQPIGPPLYDSGTSPSDTTGVVTKTLNITFNRGRYLTVFNSSSGTGTFRTVDVSANSLPSTMGGTFAGGGVVSRTYAAFPTPGTRWSSASGSSSGLDQSVFFKIKN